LLPGVPIEKMDICGEHQSWMKEWMGCVTEEHEKGIVSSSNCVAGFISECLLYGRPKTDWTGLMEGFLEHIGVPLAYSEEFGKKLYKFNQWRQSTVHAIYSRWWIEGNLGRNPDKYVDMTEKLVQPDGWIYDPISSETRIRTRMRSELFMSLAFGSEILVKGESSKVSREQLVATASSISATPYISAEYFRLRALQFLGRPEQMVVGVSELLSKCRTKVGFADFSIKDKIDDYMGVAKRSSRDIAIFSPVSTLHALRLAEASGADKKQIQTIRDEVRAHFENDPLDIPSFRMRDLAPEFGEGKTIYEIIAAAALMRK
jgi:hypothetical protein